MKQMGGGMGGAGGMDMEVSQPINAMIAFLYRIIVAVLIDNDISDRP